MSACTTTSKARLYEGNLDFELVPLLVLSVRVSTVDAHWAVVMGKPIPVAPLQADPGLLGRQRGRAIVVDVPA